MAGWSQKDEAELQNLKAQVAKVNAQPRKFTPEQLQQRAVNEEKEGIESSPWYNPIDALVGAAATPVRGATAAAGSGVSKLAQWLGGKLAGMGENEVAAYAKNPAAAEALIKLSPLGRQQVAEKALQSVGTDLAGRRAGIEDVLQKTLSGKSVQASDVGGLQEFLNPGATQTLMNEVPASEVHAAARKAGEAASFRPSQLETGNFTGSNEEASQAFAKLRQALGKAVPEAEGPIGELQQGIHAQKALTQASKNPVSALATQSPDKQALLEKMQGLVDSSALQDTADQFTAAKALEKPAKGVVDRLIAQPVGQQMIKTGTKVGNAMMGSTAGKVGEAAVGGAAMAPVSSGLESALSQYKTGQGETGWSPSDEQELQQLKAQVSSLQGSRNGQGR